ncbi:MAG: glycosyltransferase [Bacillaceae bacterium]
MVEISLCMIVKNEEEVLATCLESVQKLVDEIIIIDTGSSDKTKEIAATFGAKIYDFEWINDFAAARNYSFSKATKEYILWLDADDIILKKDLDILLNIKNTVSPSVDVVSMYYHTSFNEKGEPTFLYRRNRIIKRGKGYKWHGFVHEYLEVWGDIFTVECAVTHNKKEKKKVEYNTKRNLNIYKQKLAEGVTFTARDMYYFANELYDHAEFAEAIKQYEAFLEGEQGWYEDCIMACVRLYDCYKEIGKEEEGFTYLTESFRYDEPRPIVCCKLGDYFSSKEKYSVAKIWYLLALEYDNSKSYGFQNLIFSTWYPHLQLTVSFDRLEDREKAIFHHTKAKEFYPDHPSVIYNEAYFNSLEK